MADNSRNKMRQTLITEKLCPVKPIQDNQDNQVENEANPDNQDNLASQDNQDSLNMINDQDQENIKTSEAHRSLNCQKSQVFHRTPASEEKVLQTKIKQIFHEWPHTQIMRTGT